jgi:transketolase
MTIEERRSALAAAVPYWEKTKDIIDQLIDITLNYRQSGHPGGSRSKVHILLSTMLSGVMRWDIRRPEKRFGDRFVLGAGHTIPLLYCTLAALNEALRTEYKKTKDPRYLVPKAEERALYWEDLLKFRRKGGLSGHAEMEGKSLFLKFNTGPSGHGSPAAAGLALALKRAGAEGVKVFILEGEGGLTPGVTHETANSAYGLALDNLYFLVDWNDYGIDSHQISRVVYGTPRDWFGSHGFRVFGTESGSDFKEVAETLYTMMEKANPDRVPSAAWFKTRKGREYLKYDAASHGVPHDLNSKEFWETKRPFAEKYKVEFKNFGGPAPKDPSALNEEFRANLEAVIDVLRRDEKLCRYLASTLADLGDSVPESLPAFKLGGKGNPFADDRLYDFRSYPEDLYQKPGASAANRAALAKWGAWINAFGDKNYGRPIFLACSADLAGSTNISGFASAYGDFKGYGTYERVGTPEGVLLPQEITEFANAGIMIGMATVNFSKTPEADFDGFWGAASTYGSFSYLKYGPMRLFSQLAQDCELKTGKFIYVAGHSGPETADDSRTHFGVFSPGVTELFPTGRIINLHPWEYNEVPVLLGAALRTDVPLIALHLTRPPITLPDRAALGIPSHFEAAKGAYIVRDYDSSVPKGGTVIVQGTSTMAGMVQLLANPVLKRLNVKIVYAASYQLFSLQPEDYRFKVLSPGDRADSMIMTTQGRRLMHDWIFNKTAESYAVSSDWDDRWRTGGNLEEVLEEARLSPDWLLKGIERFVGDRPQRIRAMKEVLADL